MSIAPERYRCLGELLRDALIQFKTETALVELNRKREQARLSYLELKRAALPVARWMQDQGVGPGTRVAMLMSNQSKWLIAAYAAMYRGAILVPLDYKLSASEQAALLAHCSPEVLVTEYPLYRRFGRADATLNVPRVIVTEAPERETLPEPCQRFEEIPGYESAAEPDFELRQRDDVACIVYSSGTGGRPKGCMLTHDNYLSQLEALLELFPMEIGDRYFSVLPTNHAIDFMVGFIGPLCSGATVVHQRTLRPEFLRDTMRRMKITHMALVPLLLQALKRAIEDRLAEQPAPRRRLVDLLGALNEQLTLKRPNHGLSSRLLKPVHDRFGGHLKLLFCGGAFVERSLAEYFYRLGLPVVIGYGLTEVCTVATVNDLRPFRADSVGRTVKGVEIAIANGTPDANGHDIGEVLIRGRTVMKGYLDDPELTARTIDDEGWLHTGDLGYFDAAHHLHLVGRSKNMIVTEGGKNVYPEDIEGAFIDLPCEELAVFAANYIWPPTGEALTGEQLVAVVRVAGEDPDAALAGLTARLRERNRRLPDFKRVGGLVPWTDDFPRTASMKVKRLDLAAELRRASSRDAIVPI